MRLLAMAFAMFVVVSTSQATMESQRVGEVESTMTVKVLGRGTGTGKVEALKDAYRDAVERAVGMYVDAEQMMKNEELVKDQILTQSNAYIEKYEVVKEVTKPNGLVDVQILADVRTTALAKKIGGSMPSKTFSVNAAAARNFHARLLTDEKRSADGAELLRNALAGIDPVRLLLKASLVTPDAKIVESRDGGRDGEGNFVTLRYAFQFEIDRDRYKAEFLPSIQKVLEQISVTPPKAVRLLSKRTKYGGEEQVTFSGYSDGDRISTASRGCLDTRGRFRTVLAFTEVDAGFTVAKARLYGLSETAGKELAKWQSKLVRKSDGSARRISYNVIVQSKSGDEICVVPLSFAYGHLLPVAASCQGNGDQAVVAPLIGMNAVARRQWVDCKIPKDALAEVASITIERAE